MNTPDISRQGRLKAAACRLLKVHYYNDVFEVLARMRGPLRLLAPVLRRRAETLLRNRTILFIHVPKTSGVSIATALYGHRTWHASALFYRSSGLTTLETMESFAILRDPVERFLSAFWFVRNAGGGDTEVDPFFADDMKAIGSVDDLLAYLESRPRVYDLDYVLRPQAWFVTDRAGRILVDKLFILGAQQSEIERYLTTHGATPLRVLNRTVKEPLSLTAAQIERIRRIYWQDFDLIDRLASGGPQHSTTFTANPPREVSL